MSDKLKSSASVVSIGGLRIEAGRVYDIWYRCTTPGPDVEEGDMRAYWTGERDAYGKLTFVDVNGGPARYLFAYELTNAEQV